jgi:hypothetical protein
LAALPDTGLSAGLVLGVCAALSWYGPELIAFRSTPPADSFVHYGWGVGAVPGNELGLLWLLPLDIRAPIITALALSGALVGAAFSFNGPLLIALAWFCFLALIFSSMRLRLAIVVAPEHTPPLGIAAILALSVLAVLGAAVLITLLLARWRVIGT